MTNAVATTVSRRGMLSRLFTAAAVAPVLGVTLAGSVNAGGGGAVPPSGGNEDPTGSGGGPGGGNHVPPTGGNEDSTNGGSHDPVLT